jgi:hypothetical protein
MFMSRWSVPRRVYEGVNDGIYIVRFDDQQYRVAWAPNIEDIQAIDVFNFIEKIPIPGTGELRTRGMTSMMYANVWFGTAPTFDTTPQALKYALDLQEHEYPDTQHGICVFAGIYEKPFDTALSQSERKELIIVKKKDTIKNDTNATENPKESDQTPAQKSIG